MEGSDLVKDVTCAEAYDFETSLADAVTEASYGVPPLRRAKRPLRVAAYDYGIKLNILRRLAAHGCKVRVFPASTPAAEVLAWKPDGIFLSNGPGDPAAVTYAIDNIKEIAEERRADVRHLPRPSADGARARREDLQAEVRPSRRQSSR